MRMSSLIIPRRRFNIIRRVSQQSFHFVFIVNIKGLFKKWYRLLNFTNSWQHYGRIYYVRASSKSWYSGPRGHGRSIVGGVKGAAKKGREKARTTGWAQVQVAYCQIVLQVSCRLVLAKNMTVFAGSWKARDPRRPGDPDSLNRYDNIVSPTNTE